MKLETKFDIGQSVQLITDEEKKRRIVVSFNVYSKDYIQYVLACGLENTPHGENEMEKWEEKKPEEKNHHVKGFASKE